MYNAFGQGGINKRMIYSIHFHANSEKFNQLVQNDDLNLDGHPAFHSRQALLSPPLQPHLSIADSPKPPQMQFVITVTIFIWNPSLGT
jgi:hypothetical protein